MHSRTHPDMTTQIIEQAKAFGASLAGIASVAALKRSPSYEVYDQSPYYQGYEGSVWPEEARSVLVLALVHDPSEPELDWWVDIPGKTLGNRQLISIAKSLKQWVDEEFSINATPLPYRVEDGGILLKDAAVLAGLGVIGKNNLVITPQFGPWVRLRALFLDVDLEPTRPMDFDPCEGCDMPCRRACPQEAFRDGAYKRSFCNEEMKKNEANPVVVENWVDDEPSSEVVKYCRACELACPVAR